jgi:asparagine synthase (glutamine-hydrolysing)
MCGIFGLLSLEGRAIDRGLLRRMGDITQHRGPDDFGDYAGSGVAIGMRRLSIIDVSGGHQPLSNEDGTIWAVCNGEIYGFKALREDLQRRGHRFATASDSEVLVHLYEEFGDDFVRHLDGMYGFALWDESRRRLLIGRDRLGIKPLYYLRLGDKLAFSSELKALLEVPGVEAAVDEEALTEYLTLGYVPAPYSLVRGIKKLPPASLLLCERGSFRIEEYWTLPVGVDQSRDDDEWAQAVLEGLERAVVDQLVSDVPLGAFLSGGIDSSSIVALMARHTSQPVKTYSIGFAANSAGRYYNELPYARQVAELYATDHHEIVVDPDVATMLPKLLWHLDEPIADAAFITTFLVSEFARRDVTVILSGVGGDELFGGYRRYLGDHYRRLYGSIPRIIRRGLLVPLAQRLPSDRHSRLLDLSRLTRSFILSSELPAEQRYRSYVQLFDEAERAGLLLGRTRGDRRDSLDLAFERAASGDSLRRLMEVDLRTQLPDDLLMLTDKMTMATSLECRVPFLDHRLVELSAGMPARYKIRGNRLKHVLKKAVAPILPAAILHRPKRGFGAPMGAWLKKELAGYLGTVLSRSTIEKRGFFSWEQIERTIQMHRSNQRDYTDHLLALMNFELWCRVYLDGAALSDVTESLRDRAVG